MKHKDIDKYKELIPEYLSGNLHEKEAKELEKAIEQYPELKQELDEGIKLKEAFKAMERQTSLPSDKILQNILKEIDSETSCECTRPQKAFQSEGSSYTRIVEWFRGLFASPKVAWSFCAAQAVVVIFAFFVMHGPKPQFETMSLARNGDNVPRYNLIFNPEARLKDVIVFLEENHMKIIDGPSKKGVFVVRVRDKNVVERIRGSNIVEFLAPAY